MPRSSTRPEKTKRKRLPDWPCSSWETDPKVSVGPFTVSTSKDKETGLYVSRCKEIDYISQGRTREEAVTSLASAIDMTLQTYEALLKERSVALRNVMRLALHVQNGAYTRDFIAKHLLRFCKQGGIEPSILRSKA